MARGRSGIGFSAGTLVRVMFALAAVLAAGAALLVVVGAIPDVRDVWAPSSRGADASVPALWASVVANLVFAGMLTATVAGRGPRGRWWPPLIVALGAGAIVQALVYLDAAAAFHGPLEEQMNGARAALRQAAATDAAAGTLAVIAAAILEIGRRRLGD
ncbi:MAG: hypothetical protein AB7I38_05195 [Dehalococcoidia bacterium]